VIAGDQFEVRGPIGGPFTWSVDDGGPLFLIGRGSGMVPLMAMLRHRAAHPGAQITAHVLVSNRSATAALYTTELETLTPRERLHVAWTYTRQAPDGWRGWTRGVDDAMLRAAGPPDDAAKAAARVFVCGATPFVGTTTRLLVDQGYDPRAIRAAGSSTTVTTAVSSTNPTSRSAWRGGCGGSSAMAASMKTGSSASQMTKRVPPGLTSYTTVSPSTGGSTWSLTGVAARSHYPARSFTVTSGLMSLGKRVHAGIEEEAVEQQLAARVEQVDQAHPTVRPFEDVVLVDLEHRQPPSLRGQRIAGSGLFLRFCQQSVMPAAIRPVK